MTLKELQTEAGKTAKEHGFWENFNIPEKLCLVHSEISEALEDNRSGKMTTYPDENGKPCGFPTELVDAIIRIADMAEFLGIDLEEEVKLKMSYNKSRPYKHGRKY